MMLKEIQLVNFRGIASMELPFTTRTSAILGINGVGKSAVLDALAIALSNMTERIAGQAAKARDISPDDIKSDAAYARIQVTADLDVHTSTSQLSAAEVGIDGSVESRVHALTTWAIARNRKAGKHPEERSSDLDQLNSHTSLFNGRMLYAEANHQPTHLPLAVYYDVHRAVLDVPLRVKEKLKNTPREAYHDALGHGGTDFRGFFAWFRDREDAENERIRDEPGYIDRDLQAVRAAVESFTQFTALRIRRKPSLRMTVKKNKTELNVLQLSDGEKCLLALVGDLARRLSLLNTDRENPLHGEGVVLIDEIDLHLHPKWQRSVVASLERTFPHCQFIITTHSPQVVGELAPESVLLLRDGAFVGHAERSLGLSSGDVLEELMDANASNVAVASQLSTIRTLLDEDDIAGAEKVLAGLPESVCDIPQVLELQAAIKSLQWLEDDEA
ncbi:AAA family ATPase [Acidovorax sp. SUPP3434]|uniref:AAA family ATPase n=1 Tax=Acidovorax sp. SUPP3434 TaxID=2920880 RepID=UPI0023DE273B|nr:AAA family ATPase [Acidovorax sp. SUPP3434]GKT01010.1 AAA family ATPase [Acidovorax sp. SUPP3434]